jgi:hypothetical protein
MKRIIKIPISLLFILVISILLFPAYALPSSTHLDSRLSFPMSSLGSLDGIACIGTLPTQLGSIPKHPAPLRFGIYTGGEAGQIGPFGAPALPDRNDKILDALNHLRPKNGVFFAKVYSWSGRMEKDEDQRVRDFVHFYGGHDYRIDLVLMYRPNADQNGDIASYLKYVRHMVDLFGKDPHVVDIQITNEVNVTFSGNTSDGGNKHALDALIQGVITAKKEAKKIGANQLRIGFNWFWRTDPLNESRFWTGLRDHGGQPFASSVDWVGLDVYPGTYFPPLVTPQMAKGSLINALSVLRQCYMPIAGLGQKIPIHIEENGWPTGPGRPDGEQANLIDTMIRTFHDYAGTYNVTDYRYFALRDADSRSLNFQQHFGIMRSDYTPKPAFDVYQALVSDFSPPANAGMP